MFPTTLRRLLADPGFAPGQSQDASDISDQWFAADVPALVCRSLCRDMIHRGFTDPQGVPTADWQRLVTDV